MKIKININRSLGDTGCSINSGAIIIVDNIIEKFIQNEEQLKQQSLLDLQDIEIIKYKKATYEVDYINKYDKYKNLYNAKITITNGNSFYVKLNIINRLKLKLISINYFYNMRTQEEKNLDFTLWLSIFTLILILYITN